MAAKLTKDQVAGIARAVFNFEALVPAKGMKKLATKVNQNKPFMANSAIYAARKEARQLLSTCLQEQGMPISGTPWEAAKKLAGIV